MREEPVFQGLDRALALGQKDLAPQRKEDFGPRKRATSGAGTFLAKEFHPLEDEPSAYEHTPGTRGVEPHYRTLDQFGRPFSQGMEDLNLRKGAQILGDEIGRPSGEQAQEGALARGEALQGPQDQGDRAVSSAHKEGLALIRQFQDASLYFLGCARQARLHTHLLRQGEDPRPFPLVAPPFRIQEEG